VAIANSRDTVTVICAMLVALIGGSCKDSGSEGLPAPTAPSGPVVSADLEGGWAGKIALILLGAPLAAQDRSAPRVDLVYARVFDRNCTQITKTEMNAAWQDEATQRQSEFQAMWDKEGPAYIKTALAEVGLPFPYAEMQAYLTVCTTGGSMSTPLLINLRPFLSSTAALRGRRWPQWYFPGLVFHELMHHYVMPVTPESVLRRKYEREPVVTLNHLHVMALERVVFSKLGLAEQLTFLDRDYRTASAPEYRRAWEIVNDIEGAQSFISELKALVERTRQRR
jgi:hypothetical protein